jgi:putative heme iron utilization protein
MNRIQDLRRRIDEVVESAKRMEKHLGGNGRRVGSYAVSVRNDELTRLLDLVETLHAYLRSMLVERKNADVMEALEAYDKFVEGK